MSDSKFIIKILSGLHTGAEYYLPPGETRLGRSAQCDLVLHDKGMAEELFVFTCSGEGVQVRYLAQDSPLLLDGVEQGAPFTITDFGLLTCSALYLAVGTGDKPWKIPAPAQLFAQPERQVRPAPEVMEDEETEQTEIPPGTDEEENTADSDAGDETEAGMEDQMEEDEPEPQATAEFETQPSRRRIAVIAAMVLLASAAGLYWYKHDPAPVAAQPVARISMKEIRTIADRYGLDASFKLNKGNILSVEGYALNAGDENGFVRAMNDKGIIVKASLVITEQFKNNIQNILDQYADPARNEQVTTTIAEDDITTLVLRGYMQDAGKWREILSETVGEVESINYINKVTHWDDASGFLHDLVDEHALTDRVYLEQDLQNDRILVYFPHPDESEQSQLERLMEQYRSAYTHPEILLDPDLGNILSPPEFVENRLVGASFNARPYILFDDGQRYFVGSVTRDGYRVEEINEKFAVFSRAGKRYNYNFVDPDD